MSLLTSYFLHTTIPDPSDPSDDCLNLIRHVTAGFEESLSRKEAPRAVISTNEKNFNEASLRSILNDLALALTPWQGKGPDAFTEEEMDEVTGIVTEHLKLVDEGRYLFDEPFLTFFIDEGYLEAARDFTSRAARQDRILTPEERFQALRNVWIMNSLQLMWDIPLSITSSVYAYSLLYPYTDNLLDDSSVSPEEKRAFNHMISQALKGEMCSSRHPSADRIQELVQMIRRQYPPEDFPQVIGSIELIQKAQTRSALQDLADPLTREDLVFLSFYKGGASVLADAYLVKGSLSAEERKFAFAYGSFLQLVDDLQDAHPDLVQGHQTLYSTRIREKTLDSEICQLLAFVSWVNEPREEDFPMLRCMKNIIGTCSRLMVMDVLGRDPSLVTPGCYEELERSSRVHLSFFKEVADQMEALIPSPRS